MEHLVAPILPILLAVVCISGMALGLLIFARIVRPRRGVEGRGEKRSDAASAEAAARATSVARMPYESGMDPIHDTRRRFDVRFYLVAIAFLVFDVELLFLYPWAVVAGERRATNNSAVVDNRREGERGRAGDKETGRAGSLELSPSPPLPRSASPPLHRGSEARDHHVVFTAVMIFLALLALGFVYDWRKGIFQWR